MKFLCMTCDDPMNLDETMEQEEGTLSVVFRCDGCGWQMAMLTNPWETKAVKSLGVQIGGREDVAAPMETLRANLSGMRPDLAKAADAPVADLSAGLEDDGPKCPFSQMLNASNAAAEAEVAGTTVSAGGMTWTAEATTRIEERIPSFIRPMARVAIEKYAEEKGYSEITPTVLDETRDLFAT